MGRVADSAAFPPAHVGQHYLVRVKCTNHWTHHDLPGVLPVHPDSKGASGFSRLVLKSTPATLHRPSPRWSQWMKIRPSWPASHFGVEVFSSVVYLAGAGEHHEWKGIHQPHCGVSVPSPSLAGHWCLCNCMNACSSCHSSASYMLMLMLAKLRGCQPRIPIMSKPPNGIGHSTVVVKQDRKLCSSVDNSSRSFLIWTSMEWLNHSAITGDCWSCTAPVLPSIATISRRDCTIYFAILGHCLVYHTSFSPPISKLQ